MSSEIGRRKRWNKMIEIVMMGLMGLSVKSRAVVCSMRADIVISNRAGQVLLKDTILKADHFPGQPPSDGCHADAIVAG